MKKIAAFIATAALALAMPVAAFAAPSPTNTSSATAASGASLNVITDGWTATDPYPIVEVNNTPAWQGVVGDLVGSFRVNMFDGSQLPGPVTLAFYVGADNAGKTAHVYVIHGDDPTAAYETLADQTIASDGTVTVAIDKLSYYAITVENTNASQPAQPSQATDTGAVSPKTGVYPMVAAISAFLVA